MWETYAWNDSLGESGSTSNSFDMSSSVVNTPTSGHSAISRDDFLLLSSS